MGVKSDKFENDPELRELLECSTEEYIFCGIMNIHNHKFSDDGLCHVDFKFLANPDERMIISNKKIKKREEYETMKAYLRMNDSTIRITQWGYNELLKDIEQSDDSELRAIAELFPDLNKLNGSNVTIENCAFIPESFIYTLHSLTSSQKRKFEILLRNHSIAPWYSKTKATKADTLFKLRNSLHH